MILNLNFWKRKMYPWGDLKMASFVYAWCSLGACDVCTCYKVQIVAVGVQHFE
jgi:hypothetical protein